MHQICPYYATRRSLPKANIIVCTHQYMLDPKVSSFQSQLSASSVVIFDECHNIDETSIESLSMNLNNKVLDEANYCIKRLEQVLSESNEAREGH